MAKQLSDTWLLSKINASTEVLLVEGDVDMITIVQLIYLDELEKIPWNTIVNNWRRLLQLPTNGVMK